MKAKQRKLQKEKEKQERLNKKSEVNYNSSSQVNINIPRVVESPAKLPSMKKLKNESKAPLPLKESASTSYTTQPKQPDSPVHMPTESEKSIQIQKMMKMFNIQNISSDSIHPQSNFQYNKLKEELRQLEEEIQIQEDKLQLEAFNYAEESKMYREELDALETELFNSGKGEVLTLIESNKYYDSQIHLLTTKLEAMDNNEANDKVFDNKMKDEIQLAKMRLEREITEVRKIKDELLKIKKGTIPLDIRKRIEVMIKYCTTI